MTLLSDFDDPKCTQSTLQRTKCIPQTWPGYHKSLLLVHFIRCICLSISHISQIRRYISIQIFQYLLAFQKKKKTPKSDSHFSKIMTWLSDFASLEPIQNAHNPNPQWTKMHIRPGHNISPGVRKTRRRPFICHLTARMDEEQLFHFSESISLPAFYIY